MSKSEKSLKRPSLRSRVEAVELLQERIVALEKRLDAIAPQPAPVPPNYICPYCGNAVAVRLYAHYGPKYGTCPACNGAVMKRYGETVLVASDGGNNHR